MVKIFYTYVLLVCSLVGLTALASDTDTLAQQAKTRALTEWVNNNSPAAVTSAQSKRIVELVQYHAEAKGLDPSLVLSVMRVESHFLERASAKHGGRGLMQVVPYWHRDKLKGRSPLNASVSIEVGTQILSDCAVKSKQNMLKTLSCYSGGGGQTYYRKVMRQHTSLVKYAQAAAFNDFVKQLDSSS